MGDLHDRRYPKYSSFKNPKTTAVNTASGYSEHDGKLLSAQSKLEKLNVDVSPKNLSSKQTLYTDEELKEKSNSLGSTKESHRSHYGNNLRKSSTHQMSCNTPNIYKKRSNFITQNRHQAITSNSQPSNLSQNLNTSNVNNGSSSCYSKLENKRSPKKKPMTEVESLDEMMKNVLDSVKSPDKPSGKLPRPPYCFSWSSLFQKSGFSEDVVQLVKDKEYQEYVNQPAHKKGCGLFLGEFEDLPPRFQKKAVEAFEQALFKQGLSLPNQEINDHQYTSGISKFNIKSDDHEHNIVGNAAASNGTEIPEVLPGFNIQDNSVLKSMEVSNEQQGLSSNSQMNDFDNSQKSEPDVMENVFRMLRGEEKLLTNDQSNKKPLVIDSSIENQSLKISNGYFENTSSLSKDFEQKETSNFQDYKSPSHQVSMKQSFRQKSEKKNLNENSRTSPIHEESWKPSLDDKSKNHGFHQEPKLFSSEKSRKSPFQDELRKPPFHEKLKKPNFHEKLKKPNFHEKLKKPNFHEESNPHSPLQESRKSLAISDSKSEIKKENDLIRDLSITKVLDKIEEHEEKYVIAHNENFSNANDKWKSSSDIQIDKMTKIQPGKQELGVNRQKKHHDVVMTKEKSVSSDVRTSKNSEFDVAVQGLAQINRDTEPFPNSETSIYDGEIAKTFCLKVLSHADDIEHWNLYFSTVLSHKNFKVSNPSNVTETVYISFYDVAVAEEAYCILSKLKRNHNQSQIVSVSTGQKYNKKHQPYQNKLVITYQTEISNLHDNCMKRHNKKMRIIENKLIQLKSKTHSNKKSKFNSEEESLQDNFCILEEMKCVFEKYYDNANKLLNLSSSEIQLKNIVKLKDNFRHECNFLDENLPIYSKKDEILKMIDENQVTVLVAETGSGKSTQLVQYLLQAGFAENGRIVCTQPRKIAAISLARYVSGLLGSPLGVEVGYETGLTAKVSKSTKIVYMTDYTLLKSFARKAFVGISCIIVDEAHERSLYTDLLLGLLKQYLSKHSDFKVVITSATINPTVFLDYFRLREKDALLTVPGRIYPVDVVWQTDDAFLNWNYLEATVKKAYEVHCRPEDGGILAFLATPAETDEAVIKFHKLNCNNKYSAFKATLATLHGKLDTETQMQIFAPAEKGYRKIIFCTNSAETSITVPGIRFVVDSGMVKEKKYDSDRKHSVLVIGFINRSSANQRKGRAGRTQSGICYRMFSQKNFETDMDEATLPEILRINLQQALLEILHLKIQPLKFNFISQPEVSSIEEAMESLETLGAIDSNKQVTELGNKIVKIPLEPQLAKFILQGIDEDIGYACMIVAAMTTVSGRIFIRPDDDKQAADRKKLQFCQEEGDFHTFLWVYIQWQKVNEQYRNEWCLEKYVNPKAMKIAEQLVNELCTIMTTDLHLSVSKLNLNMNDFCLKFEDILFDCFFGNLCVFSGHERSGYVTPYLEGSYFIHPSSAVSYLGQKMPMFILYGNILKTSQPFLINVCPIKKSTIVKANQVGKFNLQIDVLEQLQIFPHTMRPFGSLVLSKYILGRGGGRIREIENIIRGLIGTNSFHLDVKVPNAEIVTYIEHQHRRTVNELIMKLIRDAHADLAKEEIVKEEMISNCSVPFSYSLSCGSEVKDILLPGEFKEISIECRSSFYNVPKLISDLEKFDLLSYCEAMSSGNKKIIALFSKVSHAQRALNFLKQDKNLIVSGKPHIVNIIEKPVPLFLIKASWIRLPCKGTGWIHLYNLDDARTTSFQLTTNCLCIDNRYVIIEPPQNGSHSIYMLNISPQADENDIKETIEKHLRDFNIRIKSVELVREKAVDVTDSDINYMKKQLFRNFAPYTSSKNLIIHMLYPKRYDMKWKAVLNFTNLEDGEKAMAELEGKLKINNCRVDLQAILKFSLYCRHIVFEVLEKDIIIFGRKCERNKKCKDFVIEPKNETLMSISFVCDKTADLFEVRNELVKLTKGCFIDCSDDKDLLNLLSYNGKTSIRAIESNFKTRVLLDHARKSITIYGAGPSYMRTKDEIFNLAKSLSRVQKKSFNLGGDSMPSGFLKTLYNRYGFGLSSFIKQFHLQYAHINVLRHQLILCGIPETIAQAESHLEEICAELDENNENQRRMRDTDRKSKNIEICPVCFDEISTEYQRLEHCGHAVCNPCLQLQLQSEVFPIVCVEKDCEELFFAQDIRNIVANDNRLKKQVAEAALKHFITTHPHEVHYCPTPNCPMVYRINRDDNEFQCPCCETDICTVCHSLYHHGMSCEMYQNIQQDGDYSLKVWEKQDAANRKKCSTCSTPIEKDGGCDHVICANCKSHMCWLCLRIFDTSDAVYEHIPFCKNAAT